MNKNIAKANRTQQKHNCYGGIGRSFEEYKHIILFYK